MNTDTCNFCDSAIPESGGVSLRWNRGRGPHSVPYDSAMDYCNETCLLNHMLQWRDLRAVPKQHEEEEEA